MMQLILEERAEFRWVLFVWVFLFVCFGVVPNSSSASSEMFSCISLTFIFFFLMNLLLIFTCLVYELSHWSVHVAFRVCVVGYFTFRSEQPFHYPN